MTDRSKVANIQKRRSMILEDLSNSICIPYNQYDTKYNRDILKAFVNPMLDASIIGYDLQDNWEQQEGETKDDAIERLFKIKRSFLNYTLNDEQYNKIANFAQARRTVNTNDLQSIADCIERFITDKFFIMSQPLEVMYILYSEEAIIQALIYYKLIPSNMSSKTKIITIPEPLIDKKVWLLGIVPEGKTKFFIPSIGAPWLYTKDDDTSGTLHNPLMILPEWISVIN